MPLMTPAAQNGIQAIWTSEDEHAGNQAEQRHVREPHQRQAAQREARVDVALHPVVGRAVPVPLERLAVVRLFDVEEHAAPEHAVDPVHLRTVRVLVGLALRVVLAVDRRPLLGHHPGREPQPEPEEVRRQRMQVERAMRLAAMQVDGHPGDGHVRQRKRDEHEPPPRQVKNAGKQEVGDTHEIGCSSGERFLFK